MSRLMPSKRAVLDELRALIGSFVDFARGVPTERGPVRLDELVREIENFLAERNKS